MATILEDTIEFAKEALEAHNRYRAIHGVAPLKLNMHMSAIAKAWVDKIAFRNTMAHSQDQDRVFRGEPMGENIAMRFDSTGTPVSGKFAVKQWYDEIERYNFETSSGPRTGHFTQVVWKESQELGIARAKTADGKWLVVANYFPAGNLLGTYSANVLPPVRGSGLIERRGSSPTTRSNPATRPTIPPPRPDRRSGGQRAESPVSNDTIVFRRQRQQPGQDIFMMASQQVKGTSVSRSTRTETTKGSDGKVVTKTIVTETTIDAEGNKSTTTREVVKEDDESAFESGKAPRPPRRFSMQNLKQTLFGPRRRKSSHPDQKSSGWRPGKFLLGRGDSSKEKKQSMKDFIKDAVEQHNKHRKLHGKAGDLKHNKDLDVLAQSWADHLAAVGALSHSTNTLKGERLGENCASKWGSGGADYTGEAVVDQWYSEVERYDYSTDHQSNAGHFSQVVWKGSKEMGIGKAFAKDGRVFVVCNYYPAGNVLGQFKDNVFPPKK